MQYVATLPRKETGMNQYEKYQEEMEEVKTDELLKAIEDYRKEVLEDGK